MAVVWAGAWAVLSLGFSLGMSLTLGFPVPILGTLVRGGITGFLTGAGFATLLTLMERNHSLEELKLSRMAAWGGLGGFGVSLLLFLVAGLFPLLGLPWALVEGVKAALVGAGLAMGTTVIARGEGG